MSPSKRWLRVTLWGQTLNTERLRDLSVEALEARRPQRASQSIGPTVALTRTRFLASETNGLSSAPKSSAKSFVFSTAFQQGSPTFHALRMSQSDMTTQPNSSLDGRRRAASERFRYRHPP